MFRRSQKSKADAETQDKKSPVISPDVKEAFEILFKDVNGAKRVAVEDLGEFIYLVTRQNYSRDRLAAMVRVVDPVHAVEHLDDAQCQYIVNRIKSQSRAHVLAQEVDGRPPPRKARGHAEEESENCCTIPAWDKSSDSSTSVERRPKEFLSSNFGRHRSRDGQLTRPRSGTTCGPGQGVVGYELQQCTSVSDCCDGPA